MKAIAWSPHHHGLLASGGGTADRYIRFTIHLESQALIVSKSFQTSQVYFPHRFWNTLTGQPMQSVDTGSQVGLCAVHPSPLSPRFPPRCATWPGRNTQVSLCPHTGTVRTRSSSGNIPASFRCSNSFVSVGNTRCFFSGGKAHRSQLQSSLPGDVS